MHQLLELAQTAKTELYVVTYKVEKKQADNEM